MSKILLYQALNSLNPSEWQQFELFLAHPLFNTNKKCQMYLSQLKVPINLSDSDHKRLFSKVFNNEKFSEQKLKDVRKVLYKHIKKFLALKEIEKNENDWDLAILKQFRNRGLNDLYNIQKKAIEKKLPIANIPQDFLFQHQLAEEAEHFAELGELRQTDDQLQQMVDWLDSFYIAKKLKWICEMMNRSRIVNTNYQLHLLDEIKLILKKEYPHLQKVIINAYYLVYETLRQADDVENFYRLKSLLDENVEKLPRAEAISLYRYAQNYCIGKINKGDVLFMEELYNIYKKLLINGLLIEKGILAHPHFKNIITLGLRLKDFDWIYTFIEESNNMLDSNIRENAYHFNLATYYYEIGNFDLVIDLLNSVKFNDVYYEISSKYILLKVYYDLNEYSLLGYLTSSFERYIKRNKEVSTQNRQGIVNFLFVLKNLAKIKEWKGFKKKDFIEKQLEKAKLLLEKKKPIVNLPWLKAKLEEL